MSMLEFLPVDGVEEAVDANSDFDAVIVVGALDQFEGPAPLASAIARHRELDASSNERVSLLAVDAVAGGRLVLSPTGPLDRDYDDVRRFSDAAAAALRRARGAGSIRPLLLLSGVPSDAAFAHSLEAALLGGSGALWEPLEARETIGEEKVEPVRALGFVSDGSGEKVARLVAAMEEGRRVARDLGGTEPERMAPPRFAEYCEKAFEGSTVKVEVISDQGALQRDYPLLSAVGRASLFVERHHPRVIRLEYEGEGQIERTLLLAGKGVVYDTGGADLKVGGHMAGMSRDKCGAAAVAGFVKTVEALAPKGLRVIAEIGAVRNSIGSEAFVSDEIFVGHAGRRVRIGNTDAEGRLVLADLLSHLRVDALEADNPFLFSVATLTGHSGLAVGPYSIAVENGPARAAKIADLLSETGDAWGDAFAISRSRREDFDFVQPRTRADDVLSCNNAPSTQTPRGHQFPMAFLTIASGLDEHGGNSAQPLPYTHIDIAGSGVEGGDWQHGRPTAAPVVALAAAFARE